jgi:4,5-DOPA dioxygenase extradiol
MHVDRMPVVFFGHGSPTNVLEDNPATKCWAEIAASIARPSAILIVSAHWQTHGTHVTAMPAPRTIHDFGRGLPAALFDQNYPARGSEALAHRVQALLSPVPITLDREWGLDHGAWSVLAKAYPEADIPVVQLSMDVDLADADHYALAQKLKPLRDEGVLIAGSGNIVHNLSMMHWADDAVAYPWAVRFSDYATRAIRAGDHAALFNPRDKIADAQLAVPSDDHFWPLLYALGSSDPDDRVSVLTDYIVFSSLSMTSLLIDPVMPARVAA